MPRPRGRRSRAAFAPAPFPRDRSDGGAGCAPTGSPAPKPCSEPPAAGTPGRCRTTRTGARAPLLDATSPSTSASLGHDPDLVAQVLLFGREGTDPGLDDEVDVGRLLAGQEAGDDQRA